MNTTLDTSLATAATPARTGGLLRRCKLAIAALGIVATGFVGSSAASAASTTVPAWAPAPAVATASMTACFQAGWRSGGVTYWGAYGAYPVNVDIYLNGQTVSRSFRTATNGCLTATGLSLNTGASYRFRVYSRLGACTYVGRTGWVTPNRATNYSFGTLRLSAVC